jgi:hypothetical protein
VAIDLTGLPDKRSDDELQTSGLDMRALPDKNTDVLRESYRSDTTDPNTAIKVADLQNKTGLPKPVVQNNIPQIERIANEPDWEALSETAPNLIERLAKDPDAFQIAKNDLDNLSGFERATQAIGAGTFLATLGIAEGIFRTPDLVSNISGAADNLINEKLSFGLPVRTQFGALERLLADAADPTTTVIADSIADARTRRS